MSTFVYDDSAPRELAEIAQRAMRREPAERFASAEELRLRLEWYLRHRGSLAISAEASRRLEDMVVARRVRCCRGLGPRSALSPVRGVPIRLPAGAQGVARQRDRPPRAASRDRDRRPLRARSGRCRGRRRRARRDCTMRPPISSRASTMRLPHVSPRRRRWRGSSAWTPSTIPRPADARASR